MYETMLVASVFIFLATSAIYLRHPAASIYHPLTFYLAFHGLVYVVRPLFAWYYDFNTLYVAIGFTPSTWDKVRVLICTNLGLTVFATVSLLVAKQPMPFKQEQADLDERARLLAWFAPFATVLILAGIFVTWWTIEFRLTGLATTSIDNFTGDSSLTAANGYFLGIGLIFGAVTVAIAYLARFRLWSLAPFLLFIILRFATGSRGPAITMAVVLALLYIYDQRSKWPKVTFAIPLILLILAFNTTLNDRGLALRNFFGLDTRNDYYSFTSNIDTKRKPLETIDIANMEFFEFLVGTVPEKTGTYDYFLSNSQLLVAPIPRVLWKEKPVGPPIRMFELYRFGRPLGITFSVPGMGWYYLGYIGVILWSALFSFIYSYCYRRFAEGSDSIISTLAYMTFISTSIVAYRDGLLYTIIAQSMFYFVPVVICLALIKFGGFPMASSLRRARGTRGGESSALPGQAPFTPHARRLAIAGAAPVLPPQAEEPEIAADTPRARRRLRMNAKL